MVININIVIGFIASFVSFVSLTRSYFEKNIAEKSLLRANAALNFAIAVILLPPHG